MAFSLAPSAEITLKALGLLLNMVIGHWTYCLHEMNWLVTLSMWIAQEVSYISKSNVAPFSRSRNTLCLQTPSFLYVHTSQPFTL
jgi:hypothetical protein